MSVLVNPYIFAASTGLSDTFNDGVIGAIWTAGVPSFWNFSSDVTVVETTDVEITPPTSTFGNKWNGYYLTNFFDASAVKMTIEIPQVATGANCESYWMLYTSNLSINDSCLFGVWDGGTTLGLWRRIGGSNSITTISYNATDHRWIRFNTTGGNFIWETSPDNVTWTAQRTVATPFTLTSAKLAFFAGQVDIEATPGSSKFDNFSVNA